MTKPSVATLPASSITYNSARINGNITDDGDDTCEARFRWLKSADEPDPAWLSNWTNRKEIPITGATGAGTNYQVKVRVYNGTGSDSAGVAYLNGDCTSFPNDLRFADNDGVTLLDHWYETNVGSDSTYRDFWIEVADNLSSNQNIYLYYGKSGESSASNAANTFIKYHGTASGDFLDTVAALGTQIRYKARARSIADGHNTLWGVSNASTSGIGNGIILQSYNTANLSYCKSTKDGTTTTQSEAPSFTTNTWYLLEWLYNTTWIKGYVDDNQVGTDITTNLPTTNMGLYMWQATAPNTGAQDWSFIGKYVSPEPAVGTPVEESYPWTETSWQNSLETGDTFYEDLAGLESATEYAYQAQARNDAGTSGWTASEYFTTCPAAPTGVSASDGEYTDKVVINWTKSTGATGYKVYRGAILVDTLGDVATYNDTGADAGIITPGTASATDGVHTDKVTLSLAGESVANGTSHSYTVKAFNDSGDSPASSADNGYRTTGSLTYQWMVSAADSDASYSNIGGATTDPYDYTSAPAGTITPGTADAADGDSPEHIALVLSGAAVSDGAGRYYKCALSATGAADQNSTSDRGYRTTGALTYQWLVSAADSDDTYSNLAGATTASHNDTTAPSPTINGGNATASDGTSTTIVTLDLANHNATDGDGRYYLCALSATGTADQNSTSNRGYRGTTSLTLQWLMSLADSDADYSEIAGGTTNPYNDTGGVTEPDGRYYKCMVNMTGASSQNSTPDRGYMIVIVAPNVTNSAATDIYSTNAILHGNITDIGWENPTIRGFEWGLSSGNYTSNWTEAGNFTTSTFDHAISGLPSGTEIFWRAFAVNSAGQGNSTELSFWTLLLPEPPLNFTITQTGPNSITINWTMGLGANGTEIRVSTIGYPGNVSGGYLAYNDTGTAVNITGLNLDTSMYYYEGWSWNNYGYSEESAQAQIGGAGMEILIFGLLPLGFLALFLWKRLALLAYASAATWGLFGFFALQTSTSPSPTQIQDIYMGLFWVCVALVMTMALLPLAMREKKEPEELYVDELDQPLEGKQEKKEPTGIRRQKPSQFAQNGKM